MKKEQEVVISLKEYKELIEIKGKYEELKEHPEIKYIYLYEPKPVVDLTPKITW